MKKIMCWICTFLLSAVSVLTQDIPNATVNVINNPEPGYLFVGPYSITHQLFLDNSGLPVFMKELEPNNLYFDINMQNSGNGNEQWITYFNNLRGEFVALNKSFEEVKTFKCTEDLKTDWHDFKIGPNGNYLLIGLKSITMDMSQIVDGGQKEALIALGVIQEFNKYGQLLFEWNPLDYIPITDLTDDMPLTEKNIRFPHVNSVNWDYDGNILVSSRHLDEITKINRQTGEVVWRLGGSKSRGNQFIFVNDTIDGFFGFSHQHDVYRLSNGNILLFDNGNLREQPYSRAVEYQLDESLKNAYKVWEYDHNKEIYTDVMGSVQRFDDGSTLLGWGSNADGVLTTEVDYNGNITYELKAQGSSSHNVRRYVLNFDVVKKNIASSGNYSFNDNKNYTGFTLNISSITGAGQVWIERHKYTTRHPAFQASTPCTIYPVRWVISRRNISNLTGTVDINLSALNAQYAINDLQVFYRQIEATGQFREVNIVSRNNDALRINFEGFGEYIICNKALTIVSLQEPLNNARTVSLNTGLRWIDIGNEVRYDLLVAFDSNFSDIVISKQGLQDSYYYYPAFQNYKKYFWKVKAVNSSCQSIWSNVWSFTTEIGYPELLSPENNSKELDSAIILKWHSVNGATKYQLQLSDYPYFTRIIDEIFISNVSQVFIDSLIPNTEYYWRVRAINGLDTSRWSEIWTFITKIATANLIFPSDDTSGLHPPVLLKWENVAGTYLYSLQVSKDENFTNILLDTNIAIPQYQFKSLEFNTIYYWRIKAKSLRSIGQWSQIWSFTTTLATPGAVTPENNSVNVKINDHLIWNQVDGATAYHLQFSTDPSFKFILIDDNNIYNNYYQFKNLSFNTKYYWRVKAFNSKMSSQWSVVYSFTTRDETYITVPVLIYPLNEAINMNLATEIFWAESENAEKYWLQVAREQDLNNLIIDSVLSINKILITDLDYNTDYFWRVMGINGSKSSEWSSVWRFSTLLRHPLLYSPVHNAVDIKTSGVLLWEQIEGAEKYHCQLADKNDFTLPIYDIFTVSTVTSVLDLRENTDYYWRVKTLTGLKESQWSDTFHFKTINISSVEGASQTFDRIPKMEIFPNPVIHSTKLKLIVLYPINVSIDLVNIIGEKFTLIPQKFYLPGIYIIELNNKELTQGFYYCWLMSDMGNALVQLLIM